MICTSVPRALLRAALAAVTLASAALAQPSSNSPLAPPANGPRRADPTWVALRDCTLHPDPETTIEHASVVFRDGVIQAVLAPERIPAAEEKPGDARDAQGPIRAARLPLGPRVIDCAGLHVYAAFIDPYVEIDVPAPKEPGMHWSANVLPQRSALLGADGLAKTAEDLRKLGFAAAAISPKAGVFRGTSAVISLAKASDDPSAARPPVYRDRAYHSLAFETRTEGYPDSEMGAIAMMRQTLSDADWQAKQRASGALVEPDNALDALLPPDAAPLLFSTDDELEVLRAAKVADEFHRDFVILGSGNEYKRLAPIAARFATPQDAHSRRPELVIPLQFPKSPEVAGVGKAERVELRELMAWEQAPTNARRLAAAGVPFSLTTARLKDRDQFLTHLRSAVLHGLAEKDALAALTVNPARVLRLGREIGTIAPGKRANLLVADASVFSRKVKFRDVWIDGIRHEIEAPKLKLEGTWDLSVPAAPPLERHLEIDTDNAITLFRDGKSVKCTNVEAVAAPGSRTGRLSFTFDHEPLDGQKGIYTSTASVDLSAQAARMVGVVVRPSGEHLDFTATRRPAEKPHAAIGKWRVIEADAKPKDPFDDTDGLLIDITKERVKLTFYQKDKDAITIESKDIKFGTDPDVASFTHELEKLGEQGKSSDNLVIEPGPTPAPDDDILRGTGAMPDGTTHTYAARRAPDDDEQEEHDLRERAKDIPDTLGLPFGPYARAALPAQETIIFENVRLWTCGPDSIIDNAWLCIENGKIHAVGRGGVIDVITRHTPRMIDCKGKQITPGLIDCHSHTGISKGVNEGGQAVTSEVRIQDVTDPDAIDWYRELAGGLTIVNSLHGSANAIGGQVQTNKIRWGCPHPDDMHMEGAKPGIKFALGENPRGANWANERGRYPQTRMGVEMLIRDRFSAATEYAAARAAGAARRDLELDALAEILAGDRLVHCHSYRQDEIIMLAKVAKDFGFKIGTYQHVLEGYKVADYIREASLGASGFSDWWAYKIEVQDAIPQAFPIMHDVGVVCSYNSDSDELARRMNTEAAKAVKYGNLAPEEALKFVTLNPAKQLMIDARVGSIEPGKDADLAIWSGDPLSTLATCEATYIDGRCYFSLEQDAAHRQTIAKERERLLQKVLTQSKKGKKERPPRGKPGKHDADKPDDKPTDKPTEDVPLTDEQREALRRWYLDQYNRGRDPTKGGPGVCGCGLRHE